MAYPYYSTDECAQSQALTVTLATEPVSLAWQKPAQMMKVLEML